MSDIDESYCPVVTLKWTVVVTMSPTPLVTWHVYDPASESVTGEICVKIEKFSLPEWHPRDIFSLIIGKN